METTPDMDSNARCSEEDFLTARRFGTVTSKNWSWMARLQHQIESLELQAQELLPVEAKMRLMGPRIQRVRDQHRAREGQIEKLWIALQRTIVDAQSHQKSCKVLRKKSWTLRRRYRISRNKSLVSKTQTKDEEE